MVNLATVKQHLRVDHDYEDDLIQGYLDAAIHSASDYLNWEELPDELPAPVAAAVLLLVGELYENRERQIDSRLVTNQTYQLLLNPYRLMTV